MTPKEKSKELVKKIKDDLFDQRAVNITDEDAVVCALIAVDEIINAIRYTDAKNDLGYVGYWYYVKQEIINF